LYLFISHFSLYFALSLPFPSLSPLFFCTGVGSWWNNNSVWGGRRRGYHFCNHSYLPLVMYLFPSFNPGYGKKELICYTPSRSITNHSVLPIPYPYSTCTCPTGASVYFRWHTVANSETNPLGGWETSWERGRRSGCLQVKDYLLIPPFHFLNYSLVSHPSSWTVGRSSGSHIL
jgi:hypothetical protein